MTQTRTPVHEIRLGLVKAAIWANQTAAGLRHHVTVGRLYKDAEGRWKSSDSLGREDLLVAAKVLDLAHTWICLEAKGPESPIDPLSPD
jgi:hypothetical protein